MKLGAFSVSLSVKNIKISREFYEKLGFIKIAGAEEENWVILKNGNTVIGIFQDMFPENILTFNPGWDSNGENLEEYNDIREIQKELLSKGIKIDEKIKEGTSGAASFTIVDPDGNQILFVHSLC